MKSSTILGAIFGVNLLFLAKVALVKGAAVEATIDALESEDLLTTDPYTTTPNVCDCKCEKLTPLVNCATEAQLQLQTEIEQLDLSGNVSTDPTNPATGLLNEESEATEDTPNSSNAIHAETTVPNTHNLDDVEAPNATTETPNTVIDANTAATPACSMPGLQPHETDCHAFNDCSSAGSADGSLRLLTKFCASNQAFNVEFGACSRDISACANDVVCVSKGGVADPISNTSYYLCEPRLIGGGFHVFHVKCSENQIFYPTLGKCYLDFNSLGQQPYPVFPAYYNWNQIQDIDIVKAELKVIKEQDKLKLKLEKEKLKAERRQQKEAAKEAERIAKEQEKLLKEQLKQESDQFICVHEGNFPSSISDNVYYSCTVKKTTYKKALRKCVPGSKFNAVSRTCLPDGIPPNATVNGGDDADDEDLNDD